MQWSQCAMPFIICSGLNKNDNTAIATKRQSITIGQLARLFVIFKLNVYDMECSIVVNRLPHLDN